MENHEDVGDGGDIADGIGLGGNGDGGGGGSSSASDGLVISGDFVLSYSRVSSGKAMKRWSILYFLARLTHYKRTRCV